MVIDDSIMKEEKKEKKAQGFFSALGNAYKKSTPAIKATGKALGSAFLGFGQMEYERVYGKSKKTKTTPKRKQKKRKTSARKSGKTITIKIG